MTFSVIVNSQDEFYEINNEVSSTFHKDFEIDDVTAIPKKGSPGRVTIMLVYTGGNNW